MVNAQGTLINFNRIIQDMPYGILGVSNNITFFAETFAALRQQAGGTKAALSALVTSLTGAGGILFAISALTTVMQIFAMTNRKTKEEVKAFTLDTLIAKTEVELFEEGIANVNRELLKLTDSQLASKMGQLAGEIANITKQLATATFLESSGQYGIIGNALFGSDPEELINKLIELNAALGAAQKINTGDTSIIGKINAQIEEQNKIINEQASTEEELKKAVEEKARLEKQRTQLLETEEERQKRIENTLKKQTQEYKQQLAEIKKRIEAANSFAKDTSFGLSFSSKSQEKLFKQQTDLMEKLKANFERLGLEWNAETREFAFAIAFSLSLPKGNVLPFGGLKDSKDKPFTKGTDPESLIKSFEKDFSFYKELVESTADIMRVEFIGAWEDIFGEANSLFEKLIQNFVDKLADLALQKAATGLFSSIVDFFLPGAGSIISSVIGSPAKQGGGTTVINVKVGDQTVQKVFLRHTPNAVKQAQFLRQL
jgi:hypothetical protein